MMRKLLATALILALTFSFAAITASAEDLTFVYSSATADNEYFAEVAEGARAFCEENGVAFNYVGADYDAEMQYTQFENWIASGVNAIICCPVDPTSIAEITAKAQEAGLVVIGQAQSIEGANGNSVVDDYAYGVALGDAAVQWINKYLADEEAVEVVLLTLDHQEQVKLRGDGMEETIKTKCPNAKIVYRQKAESSEEGMKVVETALTSNPGIKVIACVNDQLAKGAWEAVQNAGLMADDMYIGGGDYTSDGKALVQDPDTAVRVSVAIGPYDSGYQCAQMAYDILVNGKEGYDSYFTFTPMWQPGVMD